MNKKETPIPEASTNLLLAVDREMEILKIKKDAIISTLVTVLSVDTNSQITISADYTKFITQIETESPPSL